MPWQREVAAIIEAARIAEIADGKRVDQRFDAVSGARGQGRSRLPSFIAGTEVSRKPPVTGVTPAADSTSSRSIS